MHVEDAEAVALRYFNANIPMRPTARSLSRNDLSRDAIAADGRRRDWTRWSRGGGARPTREHFLDNAPKSHGLSISSNGADHPVQATMGRSPNSHVLDRAIPGEY